MGRPVRTDGARHHYDGVECAGGWRSHGRMSRLFVRATCTGCGHGFHMEAEESGDDRSKRPRQPRRPISLSGPVSSRRGGGCCSACGADRWLQPEWSEGHRRLRTLIEQPNVTLECAGCWNRQQHWYWHPGLRYSMGMRPSSAQDASCV